MAATHGDVWGQYWRWSLMKLARRQQFRPAVGVEGTMCGRRESDEERRGSPYYVAWTQPSCISNVCLHKPWALAMCSSTQRDAICPSTHTHTHSPQTDYGSLSDKLSTFVHWRNFHWATGSSLSLLLFLIQRFPPLFLRLWVDCLQQEVPGILSLGSGRQWLGWCW